jgi:hypothetical protein
VLRELNLLTTKPFLYVFNADESVLGDEAKIAELRALVAPADAVFLDAKIEAELQELDDESAAELLESIGQHERGLDALARAGFHTLRLQTYLTAGPKEARAWVIHHGDTAPKAAGVIHTDFEKGFIKAEVVSFDDLVAAGSMAAAKAAGKVRMEGKDYVMADGDVTLCDKSVGSEDQDLVHRGPFLASVVDDEGIDPDVHVDEFKMQAGVSPQGFGPVVAKCSFPSDSAVAAFDDPHGQRRSEGGIVGEVCEDSGDVVAIPCVEPTSRKSLWVRHGHPTSIAPGLRWPTDSLKA